MSSLIAWFDDRFARLYSDWRESIGKLEDEDLYQRPSGESDPQPSAGEQIVRSARVVEQTFGGITANLWDDPFEWTLPETLSTREKLLAYFDEVEATRKRGFELFKTDQDLLKEIMTPSGETQVLSLLLDTLVRAGHYHLSAQKTLDQLRKSDRRSHAQIAVNPS